MRMVFIVAMLSLTFITNCMAAERTIKMTKDIRDLELGSTVNFQCSGYGDWLSPLNSASFIVRDNTGTKILHDSMAVDGVTANYTYEIPSDSESGNWKFICVLKDSETKLRKKRKIPVIDPVADLIDGPIPAHNTITAYQGPTTCIECHEDVALNMLNSVHVNWAGPTPRLSNSDGEHLGKANVGINTFCTYANSSKNTCFSCHVRRDGNAPHPPELADIDCLMCHNDVYKRKAVSDPQNSETVTNINGETQTYTFGKVDEDGNFLTEPDFSNMPDGTNITNLARTVHLPTKQSCLRCHATAGGGDWAKRGDFGFSSADPVVTEDYHMSKDGADLGCVNCHATNDHKIAGRGIDLRADEASVPTCAGCHSQNPHTSSTLNRHASGQVSCQVCHIREYAKGGATELERDWRNPVWNPAFLGGQGGFVGEETKEANLKPEYVWFDGTSYVYNVGETIAADERGVYPMAKANGGIFSNNSFIVPIKRHFSIMPLHESGQMVAPSIVWMFMTGDFDTAVQKGMEEQGLTGSYTMVDADAEMLITHGVEPKENAPSCNECHNGTGKTPDGAGVLPFAQLGYHTMPDKVESCTLCHSSESMNWQSMHTMHKGEGLSCTDCHTTDPIGFIKPQSQLCSQCHEYKSWKHEGHKKHIEKGVDCAGCHTFEQ